MEKLAIPAVSPPARWRSDCACTDDFCPCKTWDTYLPAEWEDAAEAPLHFENYREYEITARRSVGYDADEQPCFTSHFIVQTNEVTEEEVAGGVFRYSETLAAWRLRDERWLVFRLISTNQHNEAPRGFYVLSPKMPR